MAFIINHVRDRIFSIQSKILRLFGIWPGQGNVFRRIQPCMAFINIAYIIFVLFCEFRFAITSKDLQTLIANNFVLGTRLLATVKISIMLWKRKDLQKLTKTLVDLIASGVDPISKEINRRMSRLEFRCVAGLLFMFEATLLAILASPILKWLIGGQNIWELPFLIKYYYRVTICHNKF
jgi:hypothetical protein